MSEHGGIAVLLQDDFTEPFLKGREIYSPSLLLPVTKSKGTKTQEE